MSLLNYFDRKKAPPAIGTATPVIVVGENVPPSSITEVLSSTSDEDPVYVQVVEKTRSALARRKPDIDVEVVDVVDRSSVRCFCYVWPYSILVFGKMLLLCMAVLDSSTVLTSYSVWEYHYQSYR